MTTGQVASYDQAKQMLLTTPFFKDDIITHFRYLRKHPDSNLPLFLVLVLLLLLLQLLYVIHLMLLRQEL